MKIKNVEQEISLNLFIWGLCSALNGIILFFFDNSFINAIGFQFIIWGLIDCLIAMFPFVLRKFKKESHIQNLPKLKKILGINSVLDLFYVLVGILLFLGIFNINQGHGIGVVIQGGFLLIFDFYYYVVTLKLINKDSKDIYES